MIVADSNLIAARHLTTVFTGRAIDVEKKDPVWIVPILWRYEFQNILATVIKARQISPEKAISTWYRVAEQLASNESEPTADRVLELTAYDAQFMALAIETGVPCITEDGELHRKFPGVAVSMATFLAGAPGAVREPKANYRIRTPRQKHA